MCVCLAEFQISSPRPVFISADFSMTLPKSRFFFLLHFISVSVCISSTANTLLGFGISVHWSCFLFVAFSRQFQFYCYSYGSNIPTALLHQIDYNFLSFYLFLNLMKGFYISES